MTQHSVSMGVKKRVSDRVLITGGFGYLGGRIACDIARQTSWKVRLASRQNFKSPSWLPEAEIVAFRSIETQRLLIVH